MVGTTSYVPVVVLCEYIQSVVDLALVQFPSVNSCT